MPPAAAALWHCGHMGFLFGLVALLVALAGLLATLGHVGYLSMLSAAATRRGSSGEATADYVRAQRAPAWGLAVVALVGLICTVAGGGVADLVGLVLGGGAGVAGYRALDSTRRHFRGDR
jgi:amino acid permease